jgi:hypothetical protein
MSAFSIKTWTNKGYTEEEAKYQIAIRRPNNILYYINKGFTKEEAEEKIKTRQALGGAKRATMSTQEKRKLSPRCIEFYINKGLAKQDAMIQLSLFQTMFSKEKCIKEYGEELGLEIFKARQERWQSTLNAKSAEEICNINLKKNRWLKLSEDEAVMLKEQIAKKVKETASLRSFEESRAIGQTIRKGQVETGRAMPEELVDAFLLYKGKVWAETKRNNLAILENYEKRGRTNFHLDHMYSIFEGFKNNVDIAVVGHIKNLKMIPYQDNLSKHIKCSISLEELEQLIKESNDY